jgi:hypothetical protein
LLQLIHLAGKETFNNSFLFKFMQVDPLQAESRHEIGQKATLYKGFSD